MSRLSFATIRSARDLEDFPRVPRHRSQAQDRRVIGFLLALIATARSTICTRANLAIENFALRQQLAVLRRRRPLPPSLDAEADALIRIDEVSSG
jgi:hypothetical protein